jgi:hypothetical protein
MKGKKAGKGGKKKGKKRGQGEEKRYNCHQNRKGHIGP